MSEILLLVWLILLTVVQWTWCIYYATQYRWRATGLGSVWLTKGAALAVLWPSLILNEFRPLDGWVWSGILGPLLTVATFRWLLVTIRVNRQLRLDFHHEEARDAH